MLTKILPLARLSSTHLRQGTVRCMGGYGAVEHKPSRQVAVENKLTLDDLPSPEGSWQEAYQKTQKGYNVQLGVYGIAFVVTIVIMAKNGTFFLNSVPDYKKVVVNWDKPDIPPVEDSE